MAKARKTKEINLGDYVNVTTGQMLVDELKPGDSIRFTEELDQERVDSINYITIDVDSLEFLQREKIITTKDIGYIVSLSKTLRTVLNAMCRGNNAPHTLTSLSEYLDISYDATARYIKKLSKKNIVHKYVTAHDTWYCLNPYLTRRRKYIDSTLLENFSKFRK